MAHSFHGSRNTSRFAAGVNSNPPEQLCATTFSFKRKETHEALANSTGPLANILGKFQYQTSEFFNGISTFFLHKTPQAVKQNVMGKRMLKLTKS